MGNLSLGITRLSYFVTTAHGKFLDGITNIIVYIGNVIIHTATHEHHLQVLKDVLQQLNQHKLKINLAKCYYKVSPFLSHLEWVEVMRRLVHLFSYWLVTGQSILFVSIWKVDYTN